jgi:hypothetical protein
MCLAEPPSGSFADRCELPKGHGGPHDWEEPRAEQPTIPDEPLADEEEPGFLYPGAIHDSAGRVSLEDVPDGMVVIREPDLDDLIERAFAGMGVLDIDPEGLALLARVRRAKGES